MFNIKKSVLSFAICLMAGMSLASASPLPVTSNTDSQIVQLSTWTDVRDNVLLPGIAAGIVSGLTGELPSYGESSGYTDYAPPPPPPPPHFGHHHHRHHLPPHHRPHGGRHHRR